MASIPPTMKAWTVIKNGNPPLASTLRLRTDAPSPTSPPTGTNIIVKVAYAALNPVDLHLMNVVPAWLPFRKHPVPAMDFAGEVVALGPGVSSSEASEEIIKIGTKVCGALSVSQIFWGTGTLAEYISVPKELVARVPEGYAMEAAAGMMGIAGQTVTLMVREAGGLGEGMTVVINGASGGTGTVLTQIAKAKGARVVAVCSGRNEEFVKGLGADEVVDYTRGDKKLEEVLAEMFGDGDAEGKGKVDYVFDCAGSQELYSHSPRYLREGGKFITIVGGRSQGIVPFVRNKLRPVLLGGTPRPFSLLGLSPAGDIAREVAGWVEKGWVRETPIDQVYEMEDALKVSSINRLSVRGERRVDFVR
jgi:NADPH:quinone reductase-like Zn-dependent oxidoreductase